MDVEWQLEDLQRLRARDLTLVGLLLAAITLSACTVTSDNASGTLDDGEEVRASYASRVEQAAADATSDFERAVLEDGVIDAAEYEEAVQRFVSCVDGRLPTDIAVVSYLDDGSRFAAVRDDYGVYTYRSAGVAEADTAAWQDAAVTAQSACAPGSTALIEPIYADMTYNPNNVSTAQMQVDCLLRHNLVDPGYTPDNLAADTASSAGDDTQGIDPAKATGLDTASDAVTACLITPWS